MSQNLKDDFIQLLLQQVEFGKWSNNLLENACLNIGLDKNYYYIWFPNGICDVLKFLEDTYDHQMSEILSNIEMPIGTTAKISLALKTRICDTSRSKLLSIKNSKFYLTRLVKSQALNSAWQTVDLIWRYAGDESIDFNYYSKRSLLYGVYLASQTYYNLDRSPDDNLTREFIDRSLNTITASAKCVKKVPELLKKIPFLRIFI